MKPILIVQNWAEESAGTIAEYLDENKLAYRVIANHDKEPLPDSSDVETVIILGCPYSLSTYRQHNFLKRLYSFTAEVVRRDIPLMGICFGGQMLAQILGAEVKRNETKEIGIYPCRLTDEGATDRLFAGFQKEFDVFHWHADTFAIPHGASHLAEGDECRNQAFRKNNAVAVQFHLEPRADEIPQWCDEYADELTEEGKTKADITEAFNRNADEIRRLNHRLIRNFLG